MGHRSREVKCLRGIQGTPWEGETEIDFSGGLEEGGVQIRGIKYVHGEKILGRNNWNGRGISGARGKPSTMETP